MLWAACFVSHAHFVYNFNKAPWFLLRWMVRFLTFVHKDLFPDDKSLWTTVRNLTKWPSTSTGTMVFCWSCKQSERERQNKQPTAFSVLIRFWSTHQNLFSPRKGREISSSLFDQTRLGQLYFIWSTFHLFHQLYLNHQFCLFHLIHLILLLILNCLFRVIDLPHLLTLTLSSDETVN